METLQEKEIKTMTDRELLDLSQAIFKKRIKKYGDRDVSTFTNEEQHDLTDYLLTIPFTSTIIDSFVRLNLATREELEEENRRLYAERGWEKYL